MLKRYLIAYDIPATKRRTKLHDLLQGYGVRVNYSVFELTLTPLQMKTLLFQIETIIKSRQDSVRIYPLCQICAKESFALGRETSPFAEEQE